MDLITSIGVVAASLTTGSFVPQAIKTVRSRNTQSISLLLYVAFSLGASLWLLYGILVSDVPIILANSLTSILSLIILSFKLRERTQRAGLNGEGDFGHDRE